jgi:predicted DNA-binding transcriptional regulator YafY
MSSTWAQRIDGTYGVFQGAELIPVTLRFTPYHARRVREQRWHPAQVLTERPDGGVDLTFPVADLREVLVTVLSFGAGVEVLEPEELRSSGQP